MSERPYEIRPLSGDELDAFHAAEVADRESGIGSGWEQDRLPQGSQDNALIAIAGFMRKHPLWRFSESGIAHTLAALTSNGTLDQDPRRPYTERDCERIARSAAREPAGEPSFEVEVPRLICEVPLVGRPVEWWVHGFIPQGELVMLYGAKAAGKSTFGSWLAATVTKAGGNFLHIGVEEPYARFRVRSLLGGADGDRLYGWKGPIRLPDGADELEAIVVEHAIDFVYFDSIYTHFTSPKGTLENTRARSNLEPLSQLAQRTGATVFGQFHNRRSDGSYMGSTEMVNVARVILRLERQRNEASRLYYETGNLTTEPDHALRFDAIEVVVADPRTGEVQMERQKDGTLCEMRMRIVSGVEQISAAPHATSAVITGPRAAAIDRVIDRC